MRAFGVRMCMCAYVHACVCACVCACHVFLWWTVQTRIMLNSCKSNKLRMIVISQRMVIYAQIEMPYLRDASIVSVTGIDSSRA